MDDFTQVWNRKVSCFKTCGLSSYINDEFVKGGPLFNSFIPGDDLSRLLQIKYTLTRQLLQELSDQGLLYLLLCTSRQSVWLSVQAYIVGPDLKAKLFATRAISLKKIQDIHKVWNNFCSKRTFSKWQKYYPAYNESK